MSRMSGESAVISCYSTWPAGGPVVASPVGANRQIVDDGVNGFLASTQADWIRELEKLRQNQDVRERMGSAARLKVESHYSLQVQAPRVLAILESALAASHPKSP